MVHEWFSAEVEVVYVSSVPENSLLYVSRLQTHTLAIMPIHTYDAIF